jgi:iron complex transport system substrate-binding protein
VNRLVRAGGTIALALACATAAAQPTVTDATGRMLQVPPVIRKVYAAGPPASVFVLALAPEKLAGWTRALHPDEIPFLPAEAARLPVLGRLTGRGNTANVEAVMAARPDLIVDIGATTTTYVSLAERVQETTGIPYLLFDGRLRDTPRLLRELGQAIGAGAAGEALARDIESSLARIDARVAAIPAERRPRVFYARGPNGLTTAPRGSLQAEVFEIAGARNVAEPPPGFAANLYTVSIEQVLQWQPDLIVTLDPAFATMVRTRPEWQAVPAVRDGRVYVAPGLPFGWVDAPPALNRMLGVEWLVRILHPAAFPEPLGPRLREFHRLFYHRTPTDEQVAVLIRAAGLAR